jgi:hypothetical protein
MNTEAQRIAIAEACGYSRQESDSVWFDSPNDGQIYVEDLPDYLNDLNAMHEAESWLKNDDPHAFSCYLSDLFESHGCDAIHLASCQRAEDFLKTLNLWKE